MRTGGVGEGTEVQGLTSLPPRCGLGRANLQVGEPAGLRGSAVRRVGRGPGGEGNEVSRAVKAAPCRPPTFRKREGRGGW